jgi:hypothetical protein
LYLSKKCSIEAAKRDCRAVMQLALVAYWHPPPMDILRLPHLVHLIAGTGDGRQCLMNE